MIISYARVSAVDQDLNSQINKLKVAGCDLIYAEKKGFIWTRGPEEAYAAIKAAKLRSEQALVAHAIIVLRQRFIESIAEWRRPKRLEDWTIKEIIQFVQGALLPEEKQQQPPAGA